VQERNEEGTIPRAPNQYVGAESLPGAPNEFRGRQEVQKISQVFSSIQYICYRKTSGSNMVAPNSFLASSAI